MSETEIDTLLSIFAQQGYVIIKEVHLATEFAHVLDEKDIGTDRIEDFYLFYKKNKENEAREEFAKAEEKKEEILADLEIKTILNKENPVFQSIGIGINRGIFYIGTKLFKDGEYLDAVICSDKKIYVDKKHSNEIKEKFKLNYRFSLYFDVVDYFWSNTGKYGIQNWLFEDLKVGIAEVYEDVLKLIKWKYWNSNEIVYKHHALSIISGYFLPVFEAKGRELIYGESGWGKTRLSKIDQLLAFNPVMSADFSDSSIFRIIESVKPTIIIDNFDSLDEEKKKRILHIFNVGYLSKQKAIRSEGKTFKPTGFDVFSNLVLNMIGNLNEISENRSNITRNLRTDKSEYERLEPDDPQWSEARDKLHVCALQNYKEVQKIYVELKENRLVSRELERVMPILVIAKLISEELYNELISYYLKDNERRKMKEFKDDWVYLAIEFIVSELKDADEIELKVGDIAEELAKQLFLTTDRYYDKKKHGLSVKLGSAFRNCTLFSARTLDGYTFYKFNRDNLIQFCILKDYGEKLIKKLKQDSLNSLNPTNSLNSLNSLNRSERSGSSESEGT